MKYFSNYHTPRLRPRTLPVWAAAAALLSLPVAPGVFTGISTAAEVAEEGVEVLTRGPIHEAFAETIVFKPTEGIIAPKAPPALVEELPPDQRPEGDRVQWIPGYWMWDDDTNEFLWVSGIWRNLPPDRQWIPGYWQETGSEWQWVSGYWADINAGEVEYLPPPPASVEAGPNVKRPSRESVWIPGNWRWNDERYLWSAGYWEDARPDWTWMPSYYSWTPYGYIYVDGYWDYALARRGVIYAPVRFSPAYYSRPAFRYSPLTVISLALFGDHLFLRPRCRHYYFGDYYAPEYRSRGFYSWHTYYDNRHGYDPIWAHERWRHRDDNRWERRVAENFTFFRENRDERPPHTLAAFREFASRPDKKRRFDANWVAPLETVATTQTERPLRLRAVNEAEREKFVTSGREIRSFGNKRKELAATLTPTPSAPVEDPKAPGSRRGPKEATAKGEPVRVKLPPSPIAAKTTDKPATAEDTPPPVRRSPSVKKDRPRDPSDATPDPRRRPGNEDKIKPAPAPNPTPGDKPDVKPGDRPDRTVPDTTDPKRGPGRNPKESRPDPTPAPTPKVEPRESPQPAPKVDRGDRTDRNPKIRPREDSTPTPTPKVEPRERPTPRVEPKVEPRVPKSVPRVEPRDTPRVEPRPSPKVEPRPTPRVEPRPTPRVEPRPTPRVEPRPTPRVEPRPTPRVEPRPAPRVNPTPQPRPSPAPRPAPSNPQPSTEREKGKDKKRG